VLTNSLLKITLAGVGLGTAAALATSSGHAQSETLRRGGPRDWSHGRVIATDFGPDQGKKIARDWRTYSKHLRLQHARDLQNRPSFDLLSDLFQAFQRVKQAKEPETASHLDWNLNTGGYGNVVGAPAKYSFDITAANCSDVIYFTVDQPGSATSPNVIAITNAYSTCPGNASGGTPTVKWGIQMTNGTATSAVPSGDGTILYVLENDPAGVKLHAINVNNITTNPGTYNFGTGLWSNAHVLAAPSTNIHTSEQRFEMQWAGVTNNVSSPFLDYGDNQLFFGDSAGRIQHVTRVDQPTAAKDTTNFTNACGAAQLQSPVYYGAQVIVTSYNGFLYRLNTTGASPYTCVASAQGGTGTSVGVSGALSSPVIDVTNSRIIASTNNASGFGVAGVGAWDLNFAAGAGFVSAQTIGSITTTAPEIGAFDNAFWSTNNGNYYVVGQNGSNSNTYLIRFPYNGTLGAPVGYAQLHRSGAGAVVATSPVTEFLTSSSLANKDFVFVGGGGGTYLFMNRIGAGFAGTTGAPVNMANWFATPGGGVISPIVIDTNLANVTGATATANIYYGTKGVGPATTQSTIVQLAQQF
jgi:hypothetical protein